MDIRGKSRGKLEGFMKARYVKCFTFLKDDSGCSEENGIEGSQVEAGSLVREL